jgi:hypothetical protein
VDRIGRHFLRKLQWDVVPRAAEQRRAYRRKDFMLDEEGNCTSDEHIYDEASNRRIEHKANLGDHHYIPRFMLCRGIYE